MPNSLAAASARARSRSQMAIRSASGLAWYTRLCVLPMLPAPTTTVRMAMVSCLLSLHCLGLEAYDLRRETSMPERGRRPNLLVMAVDTLRADHLSCYGYHRLTSPHLDRMAARGALFERCYAPNIPTTP